MSDITLYAKWTQTSDPDDKPDEKPEDDANKDDTYYPDKHRKDLKELNAAIADIKPAVYDANKPYRPTVKVTILNENKKKITLTEGTDYRVSYENEDTAGSATVIVRGNGIYNGEIQKIILSIKDRSKIKHCYRRHGSQCSQHTNTSNQHL